jgi:hypothetical protein
MLVVVVALLSKVELQEPVVQVVAVQQHLLVLTILQQQEPRIQAVAVVELVTKQTTQMLLTVDPVSS